MRARWRTVRAGGDAGSATVELALTTPLLVALMLLVILCGRLVSAQLDLDAAAHAAARAASLARTPATATADARRAATDTLTARKVTCPQPMLDLNLDGLRPGGVVTATLSCAVPVSDLALLHVTGTRRVSATAHSPIDVYRGGGL